MADVIAVGALALFFALAALFVVGCDRIIGPDAEALAEQPGASVDPEPPVQELAA